MEEYNKSFKYWKTQEVEEAFGVLPAEDTQILDNWLQANGAITEAENEQLTFLKNRLISKVSYWNEAAIKFYFLGPLMNLVNYDVGEYNSFLEQSMSAKINETITVSGNLDFLVATGKQIPRTPLFALHEYKPEPHSSNDPMGQLLIGMIAAQQANKAKGFTYPLYGTYTVGRLWFFITLEGQYYTKSLAYDATQSDLLQIFRILRKVKDYLAAELHPKV